MSKIIKNKNNKIVIRHQRITIKDLLSYYNLEKVEGYCKECPNYDKIWSCPSFDFSPKDYLSKFSTAIIYSGEISFGSSAVKADRIVDERYQVFEEGRREFRKFLMTLEKEHNKSEVLIAGHCFLCEECTRSYGKKCIKPDMVRYSLEAMGIEVGRLIVDVLDQKLSWKMKPTEPLVTVGAVLIK